MSQGVFLFNNKYELMDTIPAKDLTENYLDAELNGLITGGFTTTDIRDYDIYDYFGIKEENNFWLLKIRSVVKDRDRIRVHGIHIMFDELQGKILRDVKPRNAEVNTVLLNMLNETGWQAGFVVTSSKFSGSFYFQSALSALYELCAKAKCEFEPVIKFSDGKIISKTINVYDQISDDYGKLFKYGDNLLKVVAETNTDTLATRFIGRGKGEQSFDENGNPTGGFGRKIRFDTIDYTNTKDGITVNSPKGQDYIDIDKYKDLYSYPDGRPREIVIDFDDIEDRKELADATFEYALENCRPKVQLKASGLQYEKVELGETVTIIGQMDIRYKTRVFKIKKDFLSEKVVSFEFGDKLVKTMADRLKQGQVAEKEREITEQNYIKAMISMVESSFFNEDGYQYDLKADNEYNLPAGFYSFNKPIDQNPSKVIYLGAGKLMIANSKKGDGSWDFSVAIDGDAVNANVIRAGILKGGRVEWDLQNGTFLIGKSTSDYNFFWDGQVLRMRNVDIDLKNVKDYKDLQDSVDSRISQLDNDVTSRLDSYSQEFQIAEGKFNSSISSVRTELANYDTKDEVNAKINAADNSIKTYVTNNFSSISQTDKKIETSVASISSRLGSAESKITQTANEVSSKVSKNGIISAINQSSEIVTINASKINLTGATIVNGTFETKGADSRIKLINGAIEFYNSQNVNIGAIESFRTGSYIDIEIPKGGLIRFRDRGSVTPQLMVGSFKGSWDQEVYVRAERFGILDYMKIGNCKIDYDYTFERFQLTHGDLGRSFVLGKTDVDLKLTNSSFHMSRQNAHIKGPDYSFELDSNGAKVNTESDSAIINLAGLKIGYNKISNELEFKQGVGRKKFKVNFNDYTTSWAY